MKTVFYAALVLLPGFLAAQNFPGEFEALYQGEKYQEAFVLLESALPGSSGADRGRILVGLSKTALQIGGDMKDAGAGADRLMAQYIKGENFAKEALKLIPGSAEAWYWKSSNIGRWAQTKGVLDSLFRAGDMRSDLEKALSADPAHADSYYVLGMLYEALPGWPVSFGNISWSVSLGRKSVGLMEAEVRSGKRERVPAFVLELASHLWTRGWDAAKRMSEQQVLKGEYTQARTGLEKAYRFESQVTLAPVSDRQEARDLVTQVRRELEALGQRNKSQTRDLDQAKKFLAQWK